MKEKFETISIDFESLLDNAPSVYSVLSPDLKIIGISQWYLEATHAKRKKTKGVDFFHAFPFFKKNLPPTDELNLQEAFEFVAKNKEPYSIPVEKFTIPTEDGKFEEIFWSQHIIPVLYERKELLCIIHKIEDQTEFERIKIDAEEYKKRKIELEAKEKIHLKKLNESENRFTKIFNLSPIPTIILSVNNSKLEMANSTFLSFIKKEANNVNGKTLLEIGIIDTENFGELSSQLLNTGGKIKDFEFSLLNVAGEPKKMLASSDVVELDDNICFIISMIDITQRKLTENNLVESNHFLDSILENLPAIVLVKDANTLSYLKINKAAEKILGTNQHEIFGKTDSQIYEPDLANKKIAEEKKVIASKQLSEIEEQLINAEHGEVWLHTKKIPVYENANPLYLIEISEDITERKKHQDEILQLNKELEAFSYSVSHDLRAPLRAVTGYAQILDEDYSDVLDVEGKRLLKTISDNAEKMGRLIDALLTFSRLGRKELLKKDTDMNELINRAISDVNKTTSNNASFIISHLDNLYSDPEMMMQVLINFVENAIKYSAKEEKPVIEIKSEVKGSDVIFSIKDNGVGFDMRYYNKLFGVFQRLHTPDEFEGTGVGLAIIQRIINKHHGRVWAEGKVNEGATFYFSLPVS